MVLVACILMVTVAVLYGAVCSGIAPPVVSENPLELRAEGTSESLIPKQATDP